MQRTPEIKAACRHRLRLIQDIEGFMQRDPQMSRRPSPGKAGERSTFGPPARGSLLVLLLSRSIHISASLCDVLEDSACAGDGGCTQSGWRRFHYWLVTVPDSMHSKDCIGLCCCCCKLAGASRYECCCCRRPLPVAG